MILWPIRGVFFFEIRSSVRQVPVRFVVPRDGKTDHHETINLDPLDPELEARFQEVQTREQLVAILNLPGCLPNAAYAMVGPAHQEWMPIKMSLWAWRDLTWPIYALFFWWFAGRSMESLLYAQLKRIHPKIRWWENIVALFLMFIGGLGPIGVIVDPNVRTDFRHWRLIVLCGTMWFSFGVLTVIAFIVQWRLQRRVTAGGTVETVGEG